MNATPTLTDVMEAYAADAVDHARSAFGVKLDYSVESIREVEAVLAKLHASVPRGLMRLFRRAPSTETIETVCKMYGVTSVRCIGEPWVEHGKCGRTYRDPKGQYWLCHQQAVMQSFRRRRYGSGYITDRKTTSGFTSRSLSSRRKAMPHNKRLQPTLGNPRAAEARR